MDTEHRHELKSNELASFLGNLPDFIRQYFNQIIGVLLIVIAIVVIPLYKNMHNRTNLAEEAAMTSQIRMALDSVGAAAQDTKSENPTASLVASAEDLDEAAQTSKHDNLAAMALIKEAELLRAELHFSKEVNADMISENMSKARTACEQALEKTQLPTIRGMAELNLGLCDEEAGQYDNARQAYEKIIQNPDYAANGIAEQAQRRLEALADNSVKVTFVKGPEEEAPADQTADQTAAAPAGETPVPASAPAASAPAAAAQSTDAATP